MTRLPLVLALVAACPSPVEPTPPPPVDPAGVPVAESARGDVVEATFPLYGHGALTLEALRGKVVVVDLFSPHEDDWFEQHAAWRSLRAERAADLEVITVAMAVDDTRTVALWDSEPPSHPLGWDPQGALALRLGVSELPALLVYDRQGRLAASGSDRDAALRVATELLATP